MEWWMWLAGGFVLLVAELVTPSGFYIMFFGVGAILTGAAASVGAVTGPVTQWLTFTVISVLSLLLFRGKIQAIRNDMVHRVTALLTAAALEAAKTLLDLQGKGVASATRLGAAPEVLMVVSLRISRTAAIQVAALIGLPACAQSADGCPWNGHSAARRGRMSQDASLP